MTTTADVNTEDVRAARRAGDTWATIGARAWARETFASACADLFVWSAGEADSLCRRAGISYRQPDHWSRVGVLRPARLVAGSGGRRHYDEGEQGIAVVLAALSEAVGSPVPVARLRSVAAVLRGRPSVRWLRLSKEVVDGVDAPAADGALYFSVAALAAVAA